ncbi:CAP domain-containing protein [Actinomadura alba]|uniref:TerD family protein n=1 Tax=Actinomadura alba TaxID=406431 RepID=A0ABR7M0E6_9ACTN|nr:CAP domain-containing protein [Actinomadura alba]MBC6470490.1 TerD family protein [Actinomadura alba]
MSELVPGGNQILPGGTLSIEVPGPYDLSVLITGDHGKVDGDGDFVFYNQPSAPGTRLRAGTIVVDRPRLRAGASRLTVVVSPADPGARLGRLPPPTMRITGAGGSLLARFTPPQPEHETVLLLAEIYRRGAEWKVRALGQGYADGLAGVARDFGVDVSDDGATPPAVPPPRPAADHLHVSTAGIVNSQRARAGVPPMTPDTRLAAAAQAHVTTMVRQGVLTAEGPDGRSIFQEVTLRGYTYLSIAENLMSGPRTPAEFVEYCVNDEQARRPLLDAAFSDFGIAHAAGAHPGDVYWTALWARPFTAQGLARTASEVISLTNAERAEARLRPLAADPRLASAAQAHSADMVARGFYSHTSPEGGEPWDRAAAAGCTHRGIGENIACGQRSPAEVVQGWMNSPGHRANILKPDFTHIGIGFVGGGRRATYWTQLFGMSA